VTVTDQNGKTSADAVRFVLTGPDTTPPSTTITAGPTGTIAVNNVAFTWTGSDNATPVGSLVYAFRLDPLEANFSAFGSATTKTYTGLANGSYTFYVKAKDQAGNVTQPPASQSFTVNVTTTSLCPAQVIVDNLPPGQSSAQVSFTGTWSTSGQPNAFGVNGSLVSSGLGLDTYMWKTPVFSASQACTYQVFVWWTAGFLRSASVPYVVSGQTGGAVTKTFSQQTGGEQWNLHGTYTFPAGAIGQVTVTDQNGKTSADAVRFVLVP
jgi:hypothetical protein